MGWIFRIFSYLNRGLYRAIIMPILKTMFEKCGRNVFVGRYSSISYENVSIGNNSSIGQYACFMSSRAKIKIGNHVMFGPHVFIITGDYRIDIIGRFMNTVEDYEKLPENDQDVIIEDDVWIGANVIILKGITIGRGSVIAAGSVVTQDVEPYSIYGGIPARKIKDRFNNEELLKHKRMLGDNK